MDQLLKDALPMIVMLIAFAIFLIKVFDNKRRGVDKDRVRNFGMLGLFVGVIPGFILGMIFGNVSLWIGPGMMLGLALGTCIEIELQ